jgi:hypothetical protein
VQITLDERWTIGGKLHGGYLLREAVTAALGGADPLTVSTLFLHSPDPGEATVEVETLRTGRRVSQHRVRLLQDDRSCLEAMVTSGTLHPDAEPYWSVTAPPAMTPTDECARSPAEPFPGFRVGHLDFVEVRPSREGHRPGRVTAWLSMVDRPTTALDLLVLADALVPVPLDMGMPGWFPTVELTVHLRGVPAGGRLIAEQTSQLMQDGWFDEDCQIWDSRGRLVCQAKQLAGYRLPS